MSKELRPQVGYIDVFNVSTYEHMEKEEDALSKGADSAYNPLRPSSAGKCTRELAYALSEYTHQTYTKKDIREPEVVRLLNFGHYIEESFKDQFKTYSKDFFDIKFEQQGVYGFEVKSEEYDELNHLVQGSIDWCFWSKEHRGLIDAKSKKDKFHRFFRTDWDATTDKLTNMQTTELIGDSTDAYWIEDIDAFIKELRDPFFESNFWQLNFYANTDWAKKMKIDHAAILQYNKNDSRIREIRFKPNKKLYDKTYAKFQSATDAASKGNPKLAKRDFKLSSIKCAFCPYSKDCWKQDAKAAFFETFPAKKWPKDVSKLNKKIADKLESELERYLDLNALNKDLADSEATIVGLMLDNNMNKVKFKNGHIYMLKYLKTKKNYVLRRTKL